MKVFSHWVTLVDQWGHSTGRSCLHFQVKGQMWVNGPISLRITVIMTTLPGEGSNVSEWANWLCTTVIMTCIVWHVLVHDPYSLACICSWPAYSLLHVLVHDLHIVCYSTCICSWPACQQCLSSVSNHSLSQVSFSSMLDIKNDKHLQ